MAGNTIVSGALEAAVNNYVTAGFTSLDLKVHINEGKHYEPCEFKVNGVTINGVTYDVVLRANDPNNLAQAMNNWLPLLTGTSLYADVENAVANYTSGGGTLNLTVEVIHHVEKNYTMFNLRVNKGSLTGVNQDLVVRNMDRGRLVAYINDKLVNGPGFVL